MRKLYGCILFLLIYKVASSQTNSKNLLFIEPEIQYGKSIKNHPLFPATSIALFPSLSVGYMAGGGKQWHHEFGFPLVGFNIIYGIPGNDSVLGHNLSFMPEISFTTRKYRNTRWHFEYRIGTGLSCFFKPYNPVTNRNNYVIGSYITSFSNASFSFKYKLTDHLEWKAGISTLHFSNAHVTLPNIGLNSLHFTTSLRYYPQGFSSYPVRIIPEVKSSPILLNARVAYGIHEFGRETGPIGGKKYNCFAASIYASKRVGLVSNIIFGTTLKYYTSYREYIEKHNLYLGENIYAKSSSLNVFVGHEVLCGQLSMVTQIGYNFYNPFFKENDPILRPARPLLVVLETWLSGRLGAQYYFYKPDRERRRNIFAGVYINSNAGRADFPEVSLGATF